MGIIRIIYNVAILFLLLWLLHFIIPSIVIIITIGIFALFGMWQADMRGQWSLYLSGGALWIAFILFAGSLIYYFIIK